MTGLFELRGLHFAYHADRPVLDDLYFILREGDRVGVTGHNGAGKSTLLRLMVGLVRPSAGQIVAFGGERAAERDFREVRRRAGLVFQDPDDQLFCPTVRDDVAFGPLNLGWTGKKVEAAVAETLALLEIGHLADRVAHHLSGGEKRLVALATVLAMRPEVLLLDEPTAGLDEQARERLVDILLGLPQTMVIVSHDGDLHRRVATRTLELARGRLQEERVNLSSI